MKKIIKKSLLVSLFLVGSSMLSMAICIPFTLKCANGSSYSGEVCADTTEEALILAMEASNILCEME